MYEQEQGRPLAGEELSGQVWMPVKHAARAAGVPERSAFRWAKKGVVPVRRSGKVQLVEVAALRTYAARPVNARVAAVERGSQRISTTDQEDAATAAAEAEAIEERLCLLEVAWEDLELRLARVERLA